MSGQTTNICYMSGDFRFSCNEKLVDFSHRQHETIRFQFQVSEFPSSEKSFAPCGNCEVHKFRNRQQKKKKVCKNMFFSTLQATTKLFDVEKERNVKKKLSLRIFTCFSFPPHSARHAIRSSHPFASHRTNKFQHFLSLSP